MLHVIEKLILSGMVFPHRQMALDCSLAVERNGFDSLAEILQKLVIKVFLLGDGGDVVSLFLRSYHSEGVW